MENFISLEVEEKFFFFSKGKAVKLLRTSLGWLELVSWLVEFQNVEMDL